MAMPANATGDVSPNVGDVIDPLGGLERDAGILAGLLAMLTFTLIVNNVCHKKHVPIPEAIITVAVGIGCGGLGYSAPWVSGENFLNFEDASAKQFMLFFISPIIFAEGYGMKSRQFFQNITRILVHAFLGTALSMVVVGVIVYTLPPLTGFTSPMSLAECLAFGALISATDPVTTLSIFKDQNMVETGLAHLYYSVLGESILNDAVGITLFDGFSEFVKANEEFTLAAVPALLRRFLVTFFGSMAIGLICGILCALFLKVGRLSEGATTETHFSFNVPEIGVMLMMSYLPYLFATALPPLSGIVAVLFAGIAMRHYAHYNLTQTTREAFLPVAELLASLSETYVFLLLGLGTFILGGQYDASLLLWTVFACLLGRALQIYPLSVLVNCFSTATKVEAKEMHVMWFAGLRGAVAFMCALSFPQNRTANNRGVIITTTITIAFGSMVLLGWPTAPLLRWLDIKSKEQADDEKPEEAGRPSIAGPSPLFRQTPTLRPSRGKGGCGCCRRLKHGVLKIDKGMQRCIMVASAVEEREQHHEEALALWRRHSQGMQPEGGLGQSLQPMTHTSTDRSAHLGHSVSAAPSTHSPAATIARQNSNTSAVSGGESQRPPRRSNSRMLVNP